MPGARAHRVTAIVSPADRPAAPDARRHRTAPSLAGDIPGVVPRATWRRGRPPARGAGARGQLPADQQAADAPTIRCRRRLGSTSARCSAPASSLLRARAGQSQRRRQRLLHWQIRSTTLAGGVVLPLGTDGVTLNVEGTQARTAPISTIAGLQATDLFERLSTRLRYALGCAAGRPMSRSRRRFDAKKAIARTSSSTAPRCPCSQDRLRVLRANTDGDTLTSWGGFLSGHFSASFGLNGLGARSAAEALASGVPLSRQGADANFTKVDGSVNYSQAVYKDLPGPQRPRAILLRPGPVPLRADRHRRAGRPVDLRRRHAAGRFGLRAVAPNCRDRSKCRRSWTMSAS